MLDTIRAYAGEQLAQRGEVNATIARLAAYLIALVWEVRDALQGPDHRVAAERLDRERDELDEAATSDLSGARDRFAAGAELHTQLLDYQGSAFGLSGLSGIALAQGKPEAAARLIGASEYARGVVGAALWPGMKAPTDQLTSAIEAALGETSFAATSMEGARLRIPEAFGYGLAATAADAALDPFSEWSSHLRPAA